MAMQPREPEGFRAVGGPGGERRCAHPPDQIMRPYQSQLPKGAKLYLPDEAAQKRAVEERVLSVFRRWGYREVVTPAYEYFDVVALGTDRDLQEQMFKMVDRESGRLLALRADV